MSKGKQRARESDCWDREVRVRQREQKLPPLELNLTLKNVLFNPDVSLSFRDWTVDYTGKMY